jgi:Flp pilus assembly pilin Flp
MAHPGMEVHKLDPYGNTIRGKKRTQCSNAIGGFWRDEDGQDLIEYTLLMAFVALSSAALFSSAGTNVSKVWSSQQQRPEHWQPLKPPAKAAVRLQRLAAAVGVILPGLKPSVRRSLPQLHEIPETG